MLQNRPSRRFDGRRWLPRRLRGCRTSSRSVQSERVIRVVSDNRSRSVAGRNGSESGASRVEAGRWSEASGNRLERVRRNNRPASVVCGRPGKIVRRIAISMTVVCHGVGRRARRISAKSRPREERPGIRSLLFVAHVMQGRARQSISTKDRIERFIFDYPSCFMA